MQQRAWYTVDYVLASNKTIEIKLGNSIYY